MGTVLTTFLLTAWFAVSLSGFCPAARADIVELLPRIKSSVVGVGSQHPLRNPRARLTGTGFVVGDGRHVITNAHVTNLELAADKGEHLAIFIRGANGSEVRRVEMVADDPDHDLQLLKLEGAPLPAMSLARNDQAREGQLLHFTGFPVGTVLGLYPATHRAGLAAIVPVFNPLPGARRLTPKLIRRADDPFQIYQLDAVAYPGNSGSPLYDGESGLVVGVINAVFVKQSKETVLQNPSGISYAIPVRHVRELMEKAGVLF